MSPKPIPDEGFPARLRKAFGERSNTEIKDILGYKQWSSVTDILAGKYWPEMDKMIRVSEVTGCSLDWLITGKGASEDPLNFLGEEHASVLRSIASEDGIAVDALLKKLVDEGLSGRASEMMSRLGSLDERGRARLRILSELLLDQGELEKPKGRRGRRPPTGSQDSEEG